MRAYLLTLIVITALAGAGSALARGGGGAGGRGGGGGPHGDAHWGPHPHAQHGPHRKAPPPPASPLGWAKVGKHVYTSATWRGGKRGAWSTDVPF